MDEPTIEQRRAVVTEQYGLPADSDASAVLQHVITSSGHTCTLRDLMILAALFDGNVQLYITDNESEAPGVGERLQ